MKIPQRKRKVTTITLDPEIVKKAKKYNLNISRLSEDTLREMIKKLEHEVELMGAPKMKKGGEKEMTSKLPWAAAAIIIVAAVGLGAWILLKPAEVTPSGEYGTVTVGSTNVVFTGDIPTYSGIENIYIMDTGQYTYTNNLGEVTTGRMGVITSSGGSVNIPYENTFDIVVAIKIKAPENAAYAAKENGQVELTVSGSFSIGPENSANANEYVFASQNPGTTNGWVRVNVVWNNNGSGYTLPAGGSISLSSVKLYCWF